MKLEYSKNKLTINENEIFFQHEEIYLAYEFGKIVVIVIKGDYPPKNKHYNNVIAYSLTGEKIWQVEKNEDDYNNPYEGATYNDSHLILFKAKGQRIAVNINSGKLIENIDLNSNSRPW